MLVPLISIVVLCLILAAGIICYLRWHFDYWNKRQVRGPKPHLLKGTFPKTYAGKCNLMDELHEIYLAYKSSEKFVGVYTARTPKLFILDPQLATEILTTHFRHFRDNESSQWTNSKVEQLRLCSPFVSTGDAWREKRSELSAMLTTNRLRASYATMQDSAQKLVTYLKRQCNVPIDAKQLTNRFTAQFIANFIWGIDANAFSVAQCSPIHEMANVMLQQALHCVKYFAKTAAFPFLRRLRPMRFFAGASDRFFQHLTRECLEMRARSTTPGNSVIDQLLQLRTKKSLNDVQTAGHATTVLIDGYETAAIVIAHCLVLLSRDKRIQQKLRAELLAASDELNYDSLNELPYLEQCMQETLRLFPPLPTLFKLCTVPIRLANNDGTILQLNLNDAVYISSYSFQRDADYFANPEAFWPERFDAEFGGVKAFQEMGVFLPFGDGPRICPGMKLGLAEAKAAVAAVIRNFHVSSSAGTRKDNKIAADSFLLCLDGGIELIFESIAQCE